MDNPLNMKSQYNAVAKRVNSILGCIKSKILSRGKEVILPLYLLPPVVITSGTRCPVLVSTSQDGRCSVGEGSEKSQEND